MRSVNFIGLAALPLVLALAGSGPGLAAQTESSDRPTVAVFDFTGFLMGESGNSAPLGKAVSSMLITELTGRPGMHVIERAQLKALLTEQQLGLSGRVDEGTAAEVGRMLGAQYVIFGQVSSVGGNMRMDMRAVDVETSEIQARKLSGETDELLDVVVRMADLFAQEIELESPSSRPATAPVPPMATIHFSRGLDYEDKGEVERAIEEYRKALEIHPELTSAKQALERLESGGEDT